MSRPHACCPETFGFDPLVLAPRTPGPTPFRPPSEENEYGLPKSTPNRNAPVTIDSTPEARLNKVPRQSPGSGDGRPR